MGFSRKYGFKFKDRSEYFRKLYLAKNPVAKQREKVRWDKFKKAWADLSEETRELLRKREAEG